MAIFYKGISPGTHWHGTNLRLTGLSPRPPGMSPSLDGLMRHICDGTTHSCYISLSRSYGVARAYACMGRIPPSPSNSGHVYVVEINAVSPPIAAVIDPVAEIASQNASSLARLSYHHDGDQNFLLGVVDPTNMSHHLASPVQDPPGSARPPRQAHLSKELQTLVSALRDAEILVAGTIPSTCFTIRHDVW
jgi:hypothetical protein